MNYKIIIMFAAAACSSGKTAPKESAPVASETAPATELAPETTTAPPEKPPDKAPEVAEVAKPPAKSFVDWCKEGDASSAAIQHTVKELKRIASADDCDAAWKRLQDEFELILHRVSDVSPLSGMTEVTSLRIDGDGVEDLTPLASLTQLTDLGLSGHAIKDLRPLAGLKALTSLDVSYNKALTDVSPLAALPKLKYLRINDTGVTDTSALAGNKGLSIETEEEEALSGED